MINDSYIETSSGTKVHFLDPSPDEILIEDIASALSKQCRYNGHCNLFYSVAEHSVLVSGLVPNHLALSALLHDAAEAYLSDIPSPIKQYLPDYYKLEAKIEEVIQKKWHVDIKDPKVKAADMAMLRTEAHYLMPSQGKDWFGSTEDWLSIPVSDEFRPVCMPPPYAYQLFMETFRHLYKPLLVLV